MMGIQLSIHSAQAESEKRFRAALFRGEELHLGRAEYRSSAKAILGELLRSDAGSGDLTAKALELGEEQSQGRIVAKESGILAGLEEYMWLFHDNSVQVSPQKKDGEKIESGETILEIAGDRNRLLACERIGLNLLQRMSGIATMTKNVVAAVKSRNPGTNVVATRKTPWGLLDKRAVHLGGGGTHRLSLADAILIKNNHLALLAGDERQAVREAIHRAWPYREQAAFLEVEVRSEQSAIVAAQTFRDVQEQTNDGTVCFLLLDNRAASEITAILQRLREQGLLEFVFIEASGNISEENAVAYAIEGVDAISIGALTHSARSLDICQRLALIQNRS